MSGIDPFDSKSGVPKGEDLRGEGDGSLEAIRARHDEAIDILHLAELVPLVRTTFAIGAAFGDDAILASLKAIASRTSERDRWQLAFASNLGRHICLDAADPADGLRTLIGLLPRPRN